MPLELGLYLGCKAFGSPSQRSKGCLILDSEPYRYRAAMSDIAGQDIHVHQGDPVLAIVEVRNWLANVSKIRGLPGGMEVASRYARFMTDLPGISNALKREPKNLTFADFIETVDIWVESAR
jgi:hypothetical protein